MIAGIILAAGKSTRMGRTKALLPLAGGTFLSTLIAAFEAGGIDETVVVLGHDAEAIERAHAASRVRFVLNPAYEHGQLSSLLTGIEVIDKPGVEAAVVTLVDVPLVASSTIRAVIERYRSAHVPLVRPVSGERHGHPVLFARSLFGELRRAEADGSAKPVVHRHASARGDVTVDDDGAFWDIDTPAEYDRVTRVSLNRN